MQVANTEAQGQTVEPEIDHSASTIRLTATYHENPLIRSAQAGDGIFRFLWRTINRHRSRIVERYHGVGIRHHTQLQFIAGSNRCWIVDLNESKQR